MAFCQAVKNSVFCKPLMHSQSLSCEVESADLLACLSCILSYGIFLYSPVLLQHCFRPSPHYSNIPSSLPQPYSQLMSLLPKFLITGRNSYHHSDQHGNPSALTSLLPSSSPSPISSLVHSISCHLQKDIALEICLFPS